MCAPAVLRHRIILNFDAHADGENTETILDKILSGISCAEMKPKRSQTSLPENDRALLSNMPEPLVDRHFLERLERLTLHWQKSFNGLVGGHNISRFAGPGQEFLDHRNFHYGDDLRAVNWRAYLRFEKLFLKMFQVEPRVPVRLLLDASASMAAGSAPGDLTKFDYARKLAAALVYVGLVRLDSIVLQPFSSRLLDRCVSSGGRHRFQPAETYLRRLKAEGKTNYFDIARQYLSTYPQRGLTIIISDFLDDSDCLRPLQYIADFGHELLLVQLWGRRRPPTNRQW